MCKHRQKDQMFPIKIKIVLYDSLLSISLSKHMSIISFFPFLSRVLVIKVLLLYC